MGEFGDDGLLFECQLAFTQFLENDIGRHQLGQGSRVPGFACAVLINDFARLGVEQQCRAQRRCRSVYGRCFGVQWQPKEYQQQQTCKKQFQIPVQILGPFIHANRIAIAVCCRPQNSGAPGGTRTPTPIRQQILSLSRLPFRHRGPFSYHCRGTL
jgi:hypothetical protein